MQSLNIGRETSNDLVGVRRVERNKGHVELVDPAVVETRDVIVITISGHRPLQYE